MEKIKNSVFLTGNAGADPVILGLDNNKKLAKFSIAVNDYYQNSLGEPVKRVQWFNLVFWNEKVSLVENLLKKGGEISIEGHLSSHSYEDKGTTRYSVEIVVTEVTHLKNPAEKS